MRCAWLVIVLVGCGADDPPPSTCTFDDGRVFKVGDNFPFGDGCNSCHCSDQLAPQPGPTWGCTLIGCPAGSVRSACEPVSGSACTLGPACGAGCCGQGEQCVGGACVCGDGPACSAGDVCGSPDPIGRDGCGVVCCPPDGPCS